MEFNQKLQQLRKEKGLTQEELANKLFVSRTAVSKWESGRGYPNIDSLKDIAKLFSVSIDELLSSEQILSIAQQENKLKQKSFIDLVFALVDISLVILFIIPFFGQNIDGVIHEVSLLNLTKISAFLRVLYFVIVIAIILNGALIIVLKNCDNVLCKNIMIKVSLVLSVVGMSIFIASRQPYVALLTFVFLIIKAIVLIKSK